jgi:opacity protein-like surface antigen
MKKSINLAILGTLLTSAVFSSYGDDAKQVHKTTQPSPTLRETINDKDWSLEIGSGYMISDVRTDLPGYDLIPAFLMASTTVDDVGLDNFAGGIFRGNTEFFFKGFGIAVAHGIESRFVGIDLGPRYNFVQPGWKFVPFAEGVVGFAFTDSRGVTVTRGQIGQGQDFCFNFGITLGTTYNITDDIFLRFAAAYTHFSNSGLSEPDRKNRALDAIGPQLSVGYRF